MAKGIQRVSVPSTFPFGKQKVDKGPATTSLGTGFGISGKRVAGTPPINAARLRGRSRRRG